MIRSSIQYGSPVLARPGPSGPTFAPPRPQRSMVAASAMRADGPHLEAQPAQGGPGLGGIEVEDVDARRAGENVLDGVEAMLDLDGVLPHRSQGTVTDRVENVRLPQLDLP